MTRRAGRWVGLPPASATSGLRRGIAVLATVCLAGAALIHDAVLAAASQHVDSPVRLPVFSDVARSAGLDFVHVNGASQQRLLPEIIGSGGVFLDFDNDGWLDVFLVDGGSLADAAIASRARHRVYRNRGNGTFE